jgi:PAS domain S-box-containing protein
MSEAKSNFPGRNLIVAVAAVLVAFLCRQAMERFLYVELPPFVTFYPIVMIVGLLAGLWPGLIATALAALLADYWIFAPVGQFAVARTSDAVSLIFFAGMGVYMSVVAERYRTNMHKSAALKQELSLQESKAKLRRTEEDFEGLANAIPQLAWMANPDGWIFWYNQRWYSYTGTTPEQMQGWGWKSVHNPETLPEVLERWTASIATGETFDMVFPLKGEDGVFRPFLTRVMPVKDMEGNVARWFGTNTDISEQKQIEAELRKSNERLDLAIEVAGLGEWEVDLINRTGVRSPRHSQIFGHNSPLLEWSVEAFLDHVLPECRTEVGEKISSSLANGAWDFETQIRRGDGEIRWVWGRGRSELDNLGQPTRMFGTVMDITERKQFEEELSIGQQRLAAIVGSAMDAIITLDAEQRIIVFNAAAQEVFGCPVAEAIGQPVERFIPERFHVAHRKHIQDFGRTGITSRSMYSPETLYGLRTSGEEFPAEATISQSTVRGEKLYTVILRDITERKQNEEQLSKLNRTLRALNHSNQALLHAADERKLLDEICHIVTKDCGYAMAWIGFAEDDENKTVRAVAHAGSNGNYPEIAGISWADNERGSGPTGIAIRTGQPSTCRNMLTDLKFAPWRREALMRGYASSLVLPLISSTQATAVDRKAFGALTIYSKEADPFSTEEVKLLSELADDLAYGITTLRMRAARAEAEEALRASEERWATTLQSIGDAVISTDATGNVDFMNDIAQKLTGWSLDEAKGKDLSAVFDIVQEGTRIKPESPVAKVIRVGKIVGLANHTLLISRNRVEIPIEDSAAPIRDKKGQIEGVVLVFHDASEQRKVEKALRNNERLATTGRLAATIAHEIHNPLDAVGNLLYLVEHGTHEDRTREFVSEAARELGRVTQMTQQMLAFQREAAKPIPVNIGDILDSVVALYGRKVILAGINLKKQVNSNNSIMALPGELRQIFANLLGNAIEAVGKPDGAITLRAYQSRDWRSGKRGLRVVVADNGPGMPIDVRDKIFEPFFTTKGESGTGLGLWITSDIVRKYQGTIRIRTNTQQGRSGTHFSVFFPFETESDLPVNS